MDVFDAVTVDDGVSVAGIGVSTPEPDPIRSTQLHKGFHMFPWEVYA
jgi:hypothetical protein